MQLSLYLYIYIYIYIHTYTYIFFIVLYTIEIRLSPAWKRMLNDIPKFHYEPCSSLSIYIHIHIYIYSICVLSEYFKNVWSTGIFTHNHLYGLQRMVRKTENIQWAAVVWTKMPCWCQRSEDWWWCNGVGDIFLAQFRPLSTNWASFKHHSLPEYCCWPCPSLYDYSVSIFRWLLPAG